MLTANNIRPRLDEAAATRAVIVLRFSIMTLRQVECHAR